MPNIFDSAGKMKTNRNCNEELLARVKAMIDKDTRILLEEIASAPNIS